MAKELKDKQSDETETAGNGEIPSRLKDGSEIKISIRTKIAGLISVLVLLITGGLSLYLIDTQVATLKKNQRSMATRELKVMSESAAFGIVEDDPLRISDAYNLLVEVEDILAAAIYSDTNNLFARQEYIRASRRDDKYASEIKEKYPDLVVPGGFITKTFLDYREDVVKKIREILATETDPKDKGAGLKVVQLEYPDRFSEYTLTDYLFPVYSRITNRVVGAARITFTNKFIEEEISNTVSTILIVAVLSLAIGMVGALLLARVIIRPINRVVEGAHQVSSGADLNQFQVEGVDSGDEIGYLARVFNSMIRDLGAAEKEKIENSVLEDQIRQAQEIQEGMNPKRYYKKNGIQIKGFTKAAKGVGGDYFDYKMLPDGRMAVLISDVSGKSVSASLVMVMIKTALTANLQLLSNATPDEVIDTINQIMCGEAHIDKFATIFFYIYDPKTKVLEFSNGGHGPLFIYRRELGRCTSTKLDGMPLGIDDENEYSRARVKLNEGDIIILETDGITEAWDPVKNEFGWKKLQDIVIANHDKNAKDINKAVVDAVTEFEAGSPPHDDKTLVIMKVPMPGDDGYVEGE